MHELLYADWIQLGKKIGSDIIPDKIFSKDYDAVDEYIKCHPKYVYHVLIFSCMYGDSDNIRHVFKKPLPLNFQDANLILLTALHNNYLSCEDNFFENGLSILVSNGLKVTNSNLDWIKRQKHLDLISHRLINPEI